MCNQCSGGQMYCLVVGQTEHLVPHRADAGHRMVTESSCELYLASPHSETTPVSAKAAITHYHMKLTPHESDLANCNTCKLIVE